MNRYSLNVAIGGRHYCRVEIPDTDEKTAVDKAREIALRFGPTFDCSLTCWNDIGRMVTL